MLNKEICKMCYEKDNKIWNARPYDISKLFDNSPENSEGDDSRWDKDGVVICPLKHCDDFCCLIENLEKVRKKSINKIPPPCPYKLEHILKETNECS